MSAIGTTPEGPEQEAGPPAAVNLGGTSVAEGETASKGTVTMAPSHDEGLTGVPTGGSLNLDYRRAWVRRLPEQFGLALVVLVLGIFLTAYTPYFLTHANISAVFVQMSAIAIIAVGELMVIVTAGIDLSVSTVVGLSGTLAAYLVLYDGTGIALGMVLGVLSGGAVGLVNGLLITKVKLPPFIATLATLSAVGGIALILTNGQPVAAPLSFDVLGDGKIGPIPVPIVIMVLVALAGWFVLARTTLGRSIYAIGSNYQAA